MSSAKSKLFRVLSPKSTSENSGSSGSFNKANEYSWITTHIRGVTSCHHNYHESWFCLSIWKVTRIKRVTSSFKKPPLAARILKICINQNSILLSFLAFLFSFFSDNTENEIPILTKVIDNSRPENRSKMSTSPNYIFWLSLCNSEHLKS